MLSAPIRILIVAAVCVLALVGLVARESYERSRPLTATSRDIEMEMHAIDPRALLAGHYVIVNLQTQIPVGETDDPCAAFYGGGGDDDWVALRYFGPEYRIQPPPGTPSPYAPIGIAPTREGALALVNPEREAALAARGTVLCTRPSMDDNGNPTERWMTVQTQLHGIDRFYTSQQEAERIDALLRGQADGQVRVHAIINIGRDGRARLKGLNVNGEIIALGWL